MCLAEKILKENVYRTKGTLYQNYTDLMLSAQHKAVEVDQDWSRGATTYIFEDGSVLDFCGDEITTYTEKDQEK